MQVCRTKSGMRDARAELGSGGARVGLVPTMGFLHDGHLSLVRASRANCDRTVVSIFVNPTQFGPGEDLDTYPSAVDRDLALLEAEGVDAVFMPGPDEMYHPEAQTHVETERLAGMLMGALRPGHFRGVATVVTKLFNIVQPDDAFFGQKDYQQLCVIRTFVRDLDMPLRIHGLPTAREADGLAMSSRNVRLGEADRAAAAVLFRALSAGVTAVEAGETVEAVEEIVRRTILSEPRADLKSADGRDAVSLAPVTGRPTSPVILLVAARFGDVLLIDNAVATPKETR